MVEKFNCPGYSDCAIDTHLILVKYADYRKLALAAEALLKYIDDHGWGTIPKGEAVDKLRSIIKEWLNSI